MFFIKKDALPLLPLGMQKRLPVLVTGNIVLFVYFVVGASSKLGSSRPFSVAVILSSGLFLLSLFLIRQERYLQASALTSIALLLNPLWVGLLLPVEGLVSVYRFITYFLAAAIANQIIALHRSQIPVYMAASAAAFLGVSVVYQIPRATGFTAESVSTLVLLTFTLIPVNLLLGLTNRLYGDVIARTEEEARRNLDRLAVLESSLEEAKEGLLIGGELAAAAEKTKAAGRRVALLIEETRAAIGVVEERFHSGSAANEAIAGAVAHLSDAADDHHGFLDETGSALRQIGATIGGIAEHAEAKRLGIGIILQKIEVQGADLNRLFKSFDEVKTSSQESLSTAAGIMNVADTTNLLAMNASIEAAHAGSGGKGFAVIAQEIRKLSQEARGQSETIIHALEKNSQVVQATSKYVETYLGNRSGLVREIEDIFRAIEEIIQGLKEIGRGSEELNRAAAGIGEVVTQSGDNVRLIRSQADRNGRDLAKVADSVAVLTAKMDELTVAYKEIGEVIDRLEDSGRRNLKRMEILHKRLGA